MDPASSNAGSRGIRTLASIALLALAGAVSGCSSGSGEVDPSPSASPSAGSSASMAAPTTDQSNQRAAFDDALAEEGLGDLPAPVADTLATLASNVCESGGGESQKESHIDAILPVAESVASLVPDVNAQRVADTVYNAGLDSYCS